MNRKQCSLIILLFITFAILALPSRSMAKTEVIYASHKSVMGDNDSKNDVRRMCFLEAKRKVLEKAGTYIESQTKVKNYQLTKDEISTYSAALLKVEVIKEEWKLSGENMAIVMTVKAAVDTNYVEKQLSKIKTDTSVQKKIKDQQRQLQQLELKVVNLHKQLATADAPKAAPLRKERNVVFKEIDELEAKKIQILSKIKAKTKDALKYVERGMTPGDVRTLVGSPRSIDCAVGGGPGDWNYGKIWVIFEGGVVKCLIRSNCFSTCRGCYSYSNKYNCVAK